MLRSLQSDLRHPEATREWPPSFSAYVAAEAEVSPTLVGLVLCMLGDCSPTQCLNAEQVSAKAQQLPAQHAAAALAIMTIVRRTRNKKTRTSFGIMVGARLFCHPVERSVRALLRFIRLAMDIKTDTDALMSNRRLLEQQAGGERSLVCDNFQQFIGRTIQRGGNHATMLHGIMSLQLLHNPDYDGVPMDYSASVRRPQKRLCGRKV